MTAPAWQPGRLYYPDDIVRPTGSTAPVSTAIPNPGFESGDTDWSKNGFTIDNTPALAFSGNWVARSNYAAGATTGIIMADPVPVTPGRQVTASCMVRCVGASDQVGGQVRLVFFDASDTQIGQGIGGNTVAIHQGQNWRQSSVSATAPAGAASVAVQADAYNLQPAAYVLVDQFQWNLITPTPPPGLIFRAVQTEAGTSATSEPDWPSTTGVQVVDGGVTWEGFVSTRVVWEAVPILLSGEDEPDWPGTPGDTILDGTIIWTATDGRITDPNCPNSKVVAIDKAKVYAGDKDKVRYCATVNPRDWSSPNDAGFLPTGLHQQGANDVEVLNRYRSNLVPMNSTTFSMWQVDPDPALMSEMDTLEGIGSTHQKAAVPFIGDLLYLTQLGVRSVGIAAASQSLQAGDIGAPIDDLVKADLQLSITEGGRPLALVYPSSGEYWLAFSPPNPEPEP